MKENLFGVHCLLGMAWLSFWVGCISPPTFPIEENCQKSAYQGTIILNEGTFGSNQSRIDIWDGKEACQDVFKTVNAKTMGDTGQDMLQVGDTLYILMNGSNLLYQVQLPSFRLLKTLSFSAGYSMQALDEVKKGKLYVSGFDLNKKEGKVWVIATQDLSFQQEITIEKYPYGLTHDENRCYVACGTYIWNQPGNQKLAVINTDTDALEQYLNCPFPNVGQVLRYGDTLIISCRGQSYVNLDTGSAIFFINRRNLNPIKTIFLSGNLYEMQLAGDILLAIKDDDTSPTPSEATTILKMNLKTGELIPNFLPESFFQNSPDDFLYSLEYDKRKGEVYVSFATSGVGYRLNPFYQKIGTFPTGDYPRKILFYE